MNNSGIRPLEYNVLVLPQEVDEKTKGGVFLPSDAREKEQHGQMEGVIVAMSPLAFNYDKYPPGYPMPKVGDRVVFPRYQATEITGRDHGKYWLMKDKAIAGVMDDDRE